MATKERAGEKLLRFPRRDTVNVSRRAFLGLAEAGVGFLLGAVLAGAELFGLYAPFGVAAVAAAGAAARGLVAGVFLAKAAGEGACGFGMEAGDGVGAGVAALASGAGVVACSSGAAVFTGSVTVSSAMASSLKRRMHKRERLPSRANQEVLTQPSPIILISWLKVHQYQDSRSGSPPNVLWSSGLSIPFVRFLSSTASSALRRERWKPALLC